MSVRLVNRAAAAIDRRVSRRGFIARSALVGSAMATTPVAYVMRPGTAYAAVCTCSGQSCECGSLCCDGYTEFCCTITGENRCPPGSVIAGWWKADGSGFCDDGSPQPRYYLDCNADCGGCGCDSSGVCSSGCTSCGCQCANGDCSNRKTCCTSFRYGQCNQDVACVGQIICRVVTCTPPWIWEPTCTTTVFTDNTTASHHAPCLEEILGGNPLAGDWDGDGVDGIGVFADGVWFLKNAPAQGPSDLEFEFGRPGDIPIVGDWNGDGIDTVGVFRDGQFLLRNSNTSGNADIVFDYGYPDDFPVAGDWNGDGTDTIGVVRHEEWLLRLANRSGEPDLRFTFGDPRARPVVGDWNGDGRDGIGRVDNTTWTLRNNPSPGTANLEFSFGNAGGIPIVGDWDGDGASTPGEVLVTSWRLAAVAAAQTAVTTLLFGGRAHKAIPYMYAPVVRVMGADRYGTAVEATEHAFPEGASTAIVVSGETFADALAGGAAAARRTAPLLSVRTDTLLTATRHELERLAPDSIIVLGGSAAVSEHVVDDLKSIAPVKRFWGADRYETAVAMSTADFPDGATTVIVVTGYDFPDAVAAAPLAGVLNAPLLLVNHEVPSVVARDLSRLRPSDIVVLGGTAAVSADVEARLSDFAPVRRLDGATRYHTAAAISQAAFPNKADLVWIASGLDFPDALAGGAAAFANGGPLLLVSGDAVLAPVATEIRRLAPDRVVVLGGTAVVSETVANELAALL